LEPKDAKLAFYIESQGYTVDDIKAKASRLDKLRGRYDRGVKVIDDSSSEEEEEVKMPTKKTRLSNYLNQD
jgi:hypothetical protein